MYDSKLNKVILTFSQVELNRLSKFFQSPYLVTNKATSKLGLYFIANCTLPNNLVKEKVWENIFVNEKFDYGKLRKITSETLRTVEDFIIAEETNKKSLEYYAKKCEILSQKEFYNLFDLSVKNIKKIDQILDKRSSRNYYYRYIAEFSLFKIKYFDIGRFEKTNLKTITENLDKFYIIEKLRYTCDALSRNPMTKEYDDFMLKEIIMKIESNGDFMSDPAISIYHSIYYSMIDYENENHYFRLRELLEKHAGEFEQEESKKFYESAISYVANRINEPDGKFLNELFELYQSYLQRGFIFINDQIDPYNFKNIVTVGLRLKKYDWVEYFIEEYKSKLPEEYQSNVYTYHKAQLYFYIKKYGRVLQLLQEVEYDDLTYNLGAKSMLLAVYYETDEIEVLLSFIDSFNVYLNRQKKNLPTAVVQNYKNLITFTRKLIRINPGDQKEITKFKEALSKSKGVASANWLSQKIAELE